MCQDHLAFFKSNIPQRIVHKGRLEPTLVKGVVLITCTYLLITTYS